MCVSRVVTVAAAAAAAIARHKTKLCFGGVLIRLSWGVLKCEMSSGRFQHCWTRSSDYRRQAKGVGVVVRHQELDTIWAKVWKMTHTRSHVFFMISLAYSIWEQSCTWHRPFIISQESSNNKNNKKKKIIQNVCVNTFLLFSFQVSFMGFFSHYIANHHNHQLIYVGWTIWVHTHASHGVS